MTIPALGAGRENALPASPSERSNDKAENYHASGATLNAALIVKWRRASLRRRQSLASLAPLRQVCIDDAAPG